MRRHFKRQKQQRGIMLLELLLAIGLFTALLIAANNRANKAAILGEFNIALERARVIATALNEYRRTVVASAPPASPTDPWQITYPEIAAFQSASDFADLAGISIPVQTPWGTDYEVQAGAASIAMVRYTVPAQYLLNGRSQPSAGTLTMNGDGTATIVIQALSSDADRFHLRGLYIKQRFYGEETRS